MYVCLCHGITRQTVVAAMHDGASTTRKVVTATTAGSDCGRCRRHIQEIIKSESPWAGAVRP
ncbi:(2Fe-2S)-binding protein [Mycobacterium sp. 134]|uniref:(2Fe-2S)-binding protein n=1 Tax=Mycobacterium sp. 134 TaxID=3400425 RepID=UPI003AAD81BB